MHSITLHEVILIIMIEHLEGTVQSVFHFTFDVLEEVQKDFGKGRQALFSTHAQ